MSNQVVSIPAATLIENTRRAYNWALQVAARGIAVVPLFPVDTHGTCTCPKGADCGSPGKHPMTPSGLTDGSTDEQRIRFWNAELGDTNWGLITGGYELDARKGTLTPDKDKPGVVAIDVDGEEGAATWAALVDSLAAEHGESVRAALDTYRVNTGRGFHLYFRGVLPTGTHNIGKSVDTRGSGGYVVAPYSVHASGSVYTPDNTSKKILDLPGYLAACVKKGGKRAAGESKGRKSKGAGKKAAAEVKEATPQEIVEAGLGEGGRNDALMRLGCSYRAKGLDQKDIATLLSMYNLQHCTPTLPDDEVEAIARSCASYPAGKTPAPSEEERMAAAQASMGDTWKRTLLYRVVGAENPKIIYKPFQENIVRTLRNCPDYAGSLRYNRDLNRVETLRNGEWSALKDTDAGALLRFVETTLDFSPRKEACMDSIVQAAHENEVSPIKDYLNGLAWDGVPRLEQILPMFLGVEDSELNRECFVRQMVASVARIMRPGCQHDTMLVLRGEQGIRKSSFIRALYGDAAFTDQASLSDCHNKDNLAMLVGHWGVEFPELSGLRKGEVEDVKKFITSREDTYRAPYERSLSNNPRTCVLWGTTNEECPLMDTTGNRRFQIITCTRKLTLDELHEIEANRDQIWAEAVHMYNNGKRWWFGDDEGELLRQAAEVAASHIPEAPLQEKVAQAIENAVVLEPEAALHHVKASVLMDTLRLGSSPREFSLLKNTLTALNMTQLNVRVAGVRCRIYVPRFINGMNTEEGLKLLIVGTVFDKKTVTISELMDTLVDGNGTRMHSAMIQRVMNTLPDWKKGNAAGTWENTGA